MKDILHDIDAWTARGDKVAIAMVVSVKRSAPRPPGAKMAISSSGEVSGAVAWPATRRTSTASRSSIGIWVPEASVASIVENGAAM